MASLPKLRIRVLGNATGGDILELADAKDRLNFDDGVITFEGNTVHSFDQLIDLAHAERNRDREFLNVVLLQIVEGG